MKVGIYKDEMYPFYDLTSTYSLSVEVVEMRASAIERIKKVMEEFERVQLELENWYESAGSK